MQNIAPLQVQFLHIMQTLSKEINRKEFCELHCISQSKLSRILSGKIEPDFELLNYMAMFAGYQIQITLIK